MITTRSREDDLTLTNDEIIMIKRFCQHVIDNPLPLDQQHCLRQDEFVWCKDWEVIEICKYFFNGHTMYMGDPPPNRLKNNPFFDKAKIIEKVKQITNDHETVNQIIEYLTKERGKKE